MAISATRLTQGLRPVIYGDGLQTRDFIYVRDVARATRAALTATESGPVNVGTRRETNRAATSWPSSSGRRGSRSSPRCCRRGPERWRGPPEQRPRSAAAQLGSRKLHLSRASGDLPVLRRAAIIGHLKAGQPGDLRMRIVVLGADGYLGWPTALHLSARGHDVVAVDSLIRRHWDLECGTDVLWPSRHGGRLTAGTSRVTGTSNGTSRPLDEGRSDRAHRRPPARRRRALRRAALRSVLDDRPRHGVETQVNNVVGTLTCCSRSPRPARHATSSSSARWASTARRTSTSRRASSTSTTTAGRSLLYPKQPGSFYHLSKVHDSHNLDFGCRIWDLRATDLNQGVVYGITTAETALHRPYHPLRLRRHLGNRAQPLLRAAAIGEPLTVYGKGGQTRGFLDIRDTVRCMNWHPSSRQRRGSSACSTSSPSSSRCWVWRRWSAARAAHGLPTTIDHVENPRRREGRALLQRQAPAPARPRPGAALAERHAHRQRRPDGGDEHPQGAAEHRRREGRLAQGRRPLHGGARRSAARHRHHGVTAAQPEASPPGNRAGRSSAA